MSFRMTLLLCGRVLPTPFIEKIIFSSAMRVDVIGPFLVKIRKILHIPRFPPAALTAMFLACPIDSHVSHLPRDISLFPVDPVRDVPLIVASL